MQSSGIYFFFWYHDFDFNILNLTVQWVKDLLWVCLAGKCFLENKLVSYSFSSVW